MYHFYFLFIFMISSLPWVSNEVILTLIFDHVGIDFASQSFSCLAPSMTSRMCKTVRGWLSFHKNNNKTFFHPFSQNWNFDAEKGQLELLHVGISLHLRYIFFFSSQILFLIISSKFWDGFIRKAAFCLFCFLLFFHRCLQDEQSLLIIYILHYKFDLSTWWSQVQYIVTLPLNSIILIQNKL